MAIRPSSGGVPDVFVAFGSAGPGASIPTRADYDGDGQADVAIYLTADHSFAIHPSGGGLNYLVPLGDPNNFAAIPAVLDYDGDGKVDPAVYLPFKAQLTYRSSASGSAVVEGFGTTRLGETLPAAATYSMMASIPGPPVPQTVAARSLDIALTDDVLATLAGTTAASKKKG